MSATRDRIASTERIDRETSMYVMAADTATTIGAAMASAITTVFTVEKATWLPSPTSTV